MLDGDKDELLCFPTSPFAAYPLRYYIHFTDDYQKSLVVIFCESTNSKLCNSVIIYIVRHLIKNIVTEFVLVPIALNNYIKYQKQFCFWYLM